MSGIPRSIIRRIASAFSIIAVFACMASILYFVWLANTSPPHPIVETGQVVQLNNHGTYTYAKSWQAMLATSQFWIVATGFFAAAIANRVKDASERD
jgi:hypothetical protein